MTNGGGGPWLPLYCGDYLRDTAHLTTTQHGAYLLLIIHYWCQGCLPTDEGELARIVRLSPRDWRRIRGAIAAKFGDDWRHKRIDAELEKAERRMMQRRIAGRTGGIKSGLSRAIALGDELAQNSIR